MTRHPACIAATAAILLLSMPTAQARSRHAKVAGHRLHAHTGAPGDRFARTNPRHGDAPADHPYEGPGADVFRQTIQSERAPGTTSELDPAAKQSATGGPSGGLPANGSGP